MRLFGGHFGWFDPAMVDGMDDRVAEILSSNPNITEARVATVAEHVGMKAKTLVRIAR